MGYYDSYLESSRVKDIGSVVFFTIEKGLKCPFINSSSTRPVFLSISDFIRSCSLLHLISQYMC